MHVQWLQTTMVQANDVVNVTLFFDEWTRCIGSGWVICRSVAVMCNIQCLGRDVMCFYSPQHTSWTCVCFDHHHCRYQKDSLYRFGKFGKFRFVACINGLAWPFSSTIDSNTSTQRCHEFMLHYTRNKNHYPTNNTNNRRLHATMERYQNSHKSKDRIRPNKGKTNDRYDTLQTKFGEWFGGISDCGGDLGSEGSTWLGWGLITLIIFNINGNVVQYWINIHCCKHR